MVDPVSTERDLDPLFFTQLYTKITLPPGYGVYTTNQIAQQLTTGYWTSLGASSFRYNVAPGGSLTVNLTALTIQGQTLAREALLSWTDVSGIRFNEVSSGGQLTFDDNLYGASAETFYSNGLSSYSLINVSTLWLQDYGTGLNSHSYQTYIHEIGHALGLGHGGNYNGSASYEIDALYLNDSWATTVMSYFNNVENTYFAQLGFTNQFAVTPMVADGVAIAALYGAHATTRTGDTTYGFNNTSGRAVYDAAQFSNVSYTIFDNGGIDTLDYSGFATAQRINLNPETFSDVGGRVGNVTIARGAVIENVIGGSGDDTLIGNSANNRLTGGAGSDTVVYAAARDSYTISGTGSDVTVSGADGTDRLLEVEFIQFSDLLVNLYAVTDTIAPLLVSAPLDNFTGVALGANLALNFNEAVRAGTGNIVIYNANGTAWRTISVTDTTQASFSGSTMTINPAIDLAAGASYYVLMNSGVIRDTAGNAYAGIVSSTTLNFSTAAAADNAGNTLASATTLALGTTTSGSVGIGADTDDYFKFVATAAGSVTANLTGLSADIDLRALNSGGTQIAASEFGGASSESVTFDVTAGQTYYLYVDPYLTGLSDYSLATSFFMF